MAAIFDSQLTHTSAGLRSNLVVLPDLKNVRIAVEIPLPPSLGAEIYAFQVCRPPSWIMVPWFLPLRLYSDYTCPIGMLDF